MKTFKEYLNEGVDKSDLKDFEQYMKEIIAGYDSAVENTEELIKAVCEASDHDLEKQKYMVYKSLTAFTKDFEFVKKHLERLIKNA